MKNKKPHLSFEERFMIEKMLKKKNKIKFISLTLDRGQATVSREVKINGGRNDYRAKEAHARSRQAQRNKKMNNNKIIMDSYLRVFVDKKIMQNISPEQISNELRAIDNSKWASAKSIRKYLLQSR